MSQDFFFYVLSQGNQEELIIGKTKPILEDILKAKIENKDNESLYWWYYDELITNSIEQSGVEDEKKLWYLLNRFQKGLVAINVLIWQQSAVFYNFPHYFFAVSQTLKMFEIDELSIVFDNMEEYIEKHLGPISILESIYGEDQKVFYKKRDEFLEIHAHKIDSLNHTDRLLWNDEYLDNFYSKLVNLIEVNMNTITR